MPDEHVVQKRHDRIIFSWGKHRDFSLPMVFNKNNAWYEASNHEWIAFDRTTGEVQSDVDPLPSAETCNIQDLIRRTTYENQDKRTNHEVDYQREDRVRQSPQTAIQQAVHGSNQNHSSIPPLPLSDQDPPAQAQPPLGPGWHADLEPFRFFLAVGMDPVDADPDILWLRSGMHFRPMRISTGQQDNSVVPNLLVFREGLPSITIQEYIQSIRQQESMSGVTKDTGTEHEQTPVSYVSAHSEAPFGGSIQHGLETLGNISSFTDLLNMDFIPNESHFQGMTDSTSTPLPELDVYNPCNGIPRPSMSSKEPQTRQRKTDTHTTGLLPPSICGGSWWNDLSAPTSPAAASEKRSQAFDNHNHRGPTMDSSQSAIKKPRTASDGVMSHGKLSTESALETTALAPILQVDQIHSTCNRGGKRITTLPPTSLIQPIGQPVVHVHNLAQTLSINSPTSLVRDPEGISAVLPDEATREQIIKDFDDSVAKTKLGRLAGPQR
ncbi:MAG: hypothetical protein Q9209_003140 [Squamulea sp. 1 TL-2023]